MKINSELKQTELGERERKEGKKRGEEKREGREGGRRKGGRERGRHRENPDSIIPCECLSLNLLKTSFCLVDFLVFMNQ